VGRHSTQHCGAGQPRRTGGLGLGNPDWHHVRQKRLKLRHSTAYTPGRINTTAHFHLFSAHILYILRTFAAHF